MIQNKTSLFNKKKLYLIDGYNLAFRAYYAYSEIQNDYNQNINCIYGFFNMLENIIKYHQPYKFLIAFDAGSKERKEIFPEYKSNRPDLPSELILQLKSLRKICDELNVYYSEVDGYEADDVIATIAKKSQTEYDKITIVSVDKDLMQLLEPKVEMFNPIKKKFFNEADVVKQFGVRPSEMPELQAIIGDRADNIPGVTGVGIKTASPIVSKYQTLESIYENLNDIDLSDRYKRLLREGYQNAILSRELARLKSNLDVNYVENDCNFNYNSFVNKYKSFLKKVQL